MAERDSIQIYADSKGMSYEEAISRLSTTNKAFKSIYVDGVFSLASDADKRRHDTMAATFKEDPLLLRAFDTFRRARGEEGVFEALGTADNTLGVFNAIRGIGDFVTGGDTQEVYDEALYGPYGYKQSSTGDWYAPDQAEIAAKQAAEKVKQVQQPTDSSVKESKTLDKPAPESKPQTSEAPQAQSTTPKTEPNTNDTRGMFTMNESLGPNDPKDTSVDGRGIRRAKKSLLDGANQSLNIDIKNSLRDKKTRQLTLDQLNDIAKTWATSDTGRRSGIPFEDLDPETKNTMINRFVDRRTRGRYDGTPQPQQAPAPKIRQNIPQEDFDNMSEADLERELASGVRGGASASPVRMPEDFVVPGDGVGPPAPSKSLRSILSDPKLAPSKLFSKTEASDDITQRYLSNDPDAFSIEESRGPMRVATPEMPYLAPEETKFEPQVRPPQPYDRAKDLSMVQNQTSMEMETPVMPDEIPQETEFEPQVRPPQYDRAKDLSTVQNQTSLETPVMPKPEFITRENNAPAPAPAPAPALPPADPLKPASTPAKKSSGRYYSPRYGSQGFEGFIDLRDGRFIKSGGVDQKTMLGNLMRQDMADETNRQRFTNNNPFGTEYRPAPTEYLGPVAKSPTPRTTQMMRDINAMPKKQQLDIINSFRTHRGEDEIYNPFV